MLSLRMLLRAAQKTDYAFINEDKLDGINTFTIQKSKIMADRKYTFSVLWDIDGVLVNSNPLHFKTWQMTAAEDGFEFSRELFLKTFGQTSRAIIQTHWPRPLTEEEIHHFDTRKEGLYRQYAAQGMVEPIPGALETVHKLHDAKILMGAGSSGPGLNVHFMLNLLKIAPLLQAIVSGTDVEHGKPSPDIYLTAASEMGVEPSSCIVIDDSRSGVVAGKEAGMKVIGFFSDGHSESEYERADRVIRSFDEISLDFLQDLIEEK